MKFSSFIRILVLALLAVSVGYLHKWAGAQRAADSAVVSASGEFATAETRNGEEATVVHYRSDYTVYQLVFNGEEGTVTLRLPLERGDRLGDKTDLLKGEVERLVSSRGPVPLGDTGYTLVYQGGYPIWGPFGIQMSSCESYSALYFAAKALLKDDTFVVEGEDRVVGYYPYDLVYPID